MFQRIALGLSMMLVWVAAAAAQSPPEEKILWIKDRTALGKALAAGADSKPVIFWINSRPNLVEKLSKANLGDKQVIQFSKEFRCVLYEVDPKGDMAYEMLKRQGLGEYEGKITFFDPAKIDQSVRPDFRDPKSLKKFFKEIKKGIIWQIKPKTNQKQIAQGMYSILKKLGRLPKKTADKNKPKKAPPAGRDNEGKKASKPAVDPARNLFERGQSYERNSKLFEAWKVYIKAKQHDTEYGRKAVAAIKRLEGDKGSARIIQQEREDQRAGAWLSLGKSFQKNEKWKLAAGYYRRILKAYPQSKHAAEARQRLDAVSAHLEEQDKE